MNHNYDHSTGQQNKKNNYSPYLIEFYENEKKIMIIIKS